MKDPKPPESWTEETPSGDLWIGSGHRRFKVSVELDKNLVGYLVLWCPECDRRLRLSFAEVKPGEVSLCECTRFTFEFADSEDLVPLQKALDSVRKSLENIRKAFRS